MPTRYFAAALLLLMSLVVSACDTGAPPTATPVPIPPTIEATPSATASRQALLALAGVRAHLLAAIGLVKVGQHAAALQHIQIIQGEVLPALSGSDAERAAAATVNGALTAYATLLEQPGDVDAPALTTAADAAEQAVHDATTTLGGPALNTVPTTVTVLRDMLGKVEEEYGEAVQAGTPPDREPYETAFGYLQVVQEAYNNTLKPLLGTTHVEAQAGIAAQLQALGLIFTGLAPPASPPATDQVEAAVDAINHELDEVAGAAAPALDVAAQIAAARQGVATALADLAAGHADTAYEAAASAYLDHFEALEGPLSKQDVGLVTELEGHFKDFRDGIKAGKSQADLQLIANKINTGLDKAQQLLAP